MKKYSLFIMLSILLSLFLITSCWSSFSEKQYLPGLWSYTKKTESESIFRDLINLDSAGTYTRDQYKGTTVVKKEKGSWVVLEKKSGKGYDLSLVLTDSNKNVVTYTFTIVERSKVLVLVKTGESGLLTGREYVRAGK